MGSYANFENLTTMAMPSEVKNGVNYPLTRQGSIYSMTFDELQSMGSLGRDIGSLNMEELLKNLWSAEEIQANSTINGGNGNGGSSISSCNAPCGPCPNGNLQRQGSLTLPRMISQKTVDDVWKELFKENGGGGGGFRDLGFSNNPFQREPTLGEITLEEFLSRAGVVREEILPFEKLSKPIENPNNGSFSGGFRQPNNGFTIDFQQTSINKGYNNDFSFNLELNGNRAMSPPPQQLQHHPRLNPLPFTSPQPPRSRVISSAADIEAISGVTNSPRAVNHINGLMNVSSSGLTNSVVANSLLTANHNGLTNVLSPGVTNLVANSPRTVNHNGLMNVAASSMTNSTSVVANSPRTVNHNSLMNVSASSTTNSVVDNSPRTVNHNGLMNFSASSMTNSVVDNSPRTVNHNGLMNVTSSGVTNSVANSPRTVNHNSLMNVSTSAMTNPAVANSPRAVNHNGLMNVSTSAMTNPAVANSPRVINHNGLMSISTSGTTNPAVAVNHNGLMNVSTSGMTNPAVANSPRTVNHNVLMNVATSSLVTNPVRVPNSPRAVGQMNITGLHNMKTTTTVSRDRSRETSSKNNMDSPTLSTSPYAYNQSGVQGRRSSANLDKQVERRRRRMLKNRESAARSRARKQEYITELEEEIAKLKETNKKLKEKQVELMNMQINKEMDSGKEVKRRRLRRTLTGQW